MITDQLLRRYPIVSDQMTPERLRTVLSNLERVLIRSTPGDVVEFGCYMGTTSLFLRRMLDTCQESAKRKFHAYDSFIGLPPKVPEDNSSAGEQFKPGALRISKKQLLHTFCQAHLEPPVIHKGWFSELQPADIPEHIAFAFLDGDFYDSIMSSLRLVWPRLGPGAVIAIDDYGRAALPGVERAVSTFLQARQANLHIAHNVGIMGL